mgnify:CR=1 FL=1
MWLLLLALADSPPTQEGQAALQSCEMTPGGWVCTYKMPPITLVGTAEAKPPQSVPAPSVTPRRTLPEVAPKTEAEIAEDARRMRLIAKCADAGWLSICLPGERKEARRLKAEHEASTALRGKVTGLLSENRCDEAVKTALSGGDLALAREVRSFCGL